MPITFLDEEEDIAPLAPATKRKITFLDEEEDDTAPVTPQPAYQYDPSGFRRKKPVAAEPKPEEQGILRQVADIPLGIARGGVTGIKMMTDILGADNPVSQSLAGVEDYMAGLMSAQAKEDQQEISRILKDAEDKGFGEQVKAGIKAFSIAPVDIMSQALGTMAPVIATGLAGSAAKLGALGMRAVQAGVGAGMGAGMIKGEIYNEVKNELVNSGIAEDAAEKAAVEAQSYGGKNLDQILLGAGLGAASTLGAEGIITRILTKQGTAPAAGVVSRVLKGGITEAIPEGAQAAQEQLAKNVALQREGFDVDPSRGVVSAATMEAVAGAPIGGIAGAVERPAPIKTLAEENLEQTNEIARKVAENGAPLTASAIQDQAATNLRQDELAKQLEAQLEEELVAVKQPTAAAPTPMSKDEFKAIYSAAAPEELDAAEAGFTEQAATAETEEGRISAQNALEAIKEVKATVTPPAPPVEPTITPAVTPEVTPAVPTAQPTIQDATQEIIQPEGVREEPQDRVEGQPTEEAGVSDSLLGAARGQEEGQVAPAATAIPEAITRAIEERRPISAPFVLQYGVDLPSGWRYEDDFFVPPAAPEPTISEIPQTSELVGAEPTQPIISEIPRTSEIVGAEPTQPTIREVPEISPIVGAEPAAIVEQAPLVAEAPAVTPVPVAETPAVAPAPEVAPAPVEEVEFAELRNLMEKRGQAQSKVKGVKFSKKDEARYNELLPKYRSRLFETITPEADPIVWKDIQGNDIKVSQKGTFYTVENGRVRTGPAFQSEGFIKDVSPQPVSAAVVESNNVPLPEGYTKQGELYVYQPVAPTPVTTPPVTEAVTPAPAAPTPAAPEVAEKIALEIVPQEVLEAFSENQPIMERIRKDALEKKGGSLQTYITASVRTKGVPKSQIQPITNKILKQFQESGLIADIEEAVTNEVENISSIKEKKKSDEIKLQAALQRTGETYELDAAIQDYKNKQIELERAQKSMLTTPALRQMERVGAKNNLEKSRQRLISIAATPAVSEAPTLTPAAPAAAAPVGIAVGNRVKTKTTPQSYVVEEVLPQSAREAELGEQYYRIKNERTGEVQTVESNDIKPIKGKGVRKMAAATRNEEYMRLAQNPEANREQLQRMVDEAARRAGYDSPLVFHGSSDKPFNIFKTKRGRGGTREGGAFFTPTETLANYFANIAQQVKYGGLTDKPGIIYRAYLKIDKPLNIDENFKSEGTIEDKNINRIKAAKKFGFDGIIWKNTIEPFHPDGVDQYIVFNPEQIKSADPVTYDDAGNIIPLEERFQPTSPDIRRQAIDTTPEGILITPLDKRYAFKEVFDVAYDMFGGKIPEGFAIVNDSTNKDFEFKAAYVPESGEIIVNLAYLNKNDDIRDTITHELGHYIYGDPEFRAAFDQFIASLSPEARADLDAYVDTAYNKETGEIRLEEKMVRAFVDQFINEEQAPMWRSMLDAIKRFLNKLGFKFNISDRDAISVFTAALDRYKAGEAISREGGARKIIDDLTAMDAEYLAAVERGDMETAQRMVDEAAKAAGYDSPKVYHGSTSDIEIFDTNKIPTGDTQGSYFTDSKSYAATRGEPKSFFLKIENPASNEIEFEAGLLAENQTEKPKRGETYRADDGRLYLTRKKTGDFVRNKLESQGYDGVVREIAGATTYIAFNPSQIKSADPVTYDDAGDVIPLSQRFRPTSPDIRRMAAEPAPKRRKEQVGGAEREETRYITTPKGILSMNTDVLREKFFDGTSVSPEKTTQAWRYISRLLDIKSGNANEFAGEINDTVDADLVAKREAAIAAGEKVDPEEDVSKRIGAAMFSVELMNYAGRLAEQGDTKMLKFMIRNVNSMPTDKLAGDISDAARALRTRLEYDVSGFSAYTTEQKAKVDRTAAVMFGTDKPSKEQSEAVKEAINESEKAELGNPEEVAKEVEKVEKRTKRKITDKVERIIGKGSLRGMIQAIKDTPLEKQQERGWIEKVVNDFLINAGLSPEAASTASKLYESLIAERFAAAKQKAFEDNLKKAAPWKNYAARNSRLASEALSKIQTAIRTGALDPEKNTESIIAAESGWSGFTKDQYQRIVQLDSIINDPKRDDVTRREAMADLNKIIADAKLPVRFKDALASYYVGNALMGIPTLTVNIASPIGFTVRNLMTDVSKYAFTDPARIPLAFETFMESMRSWYDQTSYAFKNQIYLNDVVEYLQGQNVLRELFDKGKKQWAEGKYAEGFVNMAVGMTQITGRVLSSLDQGAISMLENQNITRYALEALANTKGKVPKDKLKEFANMVIDTRRKTIAQSIANGMPRDRAGVLADLAVKSEVISALAQYDVNPMNVLDASINDALQSVGRNKTLTIKGIEKSQKDLSDEGFLSYWPIKLLELVAESTGREGSSMQIFAKMLYGFALVPARVFHNVAWFSPYGFIRLGIDKYKKNRGEDSPYAMSLQTEAQYKQRLTETIAGSVAMLGLAALSSASSDEDDDKKFKIVITGNGPSATTDKQYFDSWMKKWKPYSVHIVVNGNIIPINIGRGGEALFFPIMLAGALDDFRIKQKQNLTKKEPEDLSAIAQMLGSSFFALAQRGPYAAFTKPLFDASKQGRVTEELVSQAGFFGKTFIPVVGSSLSRNISDLLNDPVDRSSIEGAIYANTPVVGPWLGTKALNALGQPIRADDWGDRLFKLGVPVVFSFPKNTPENELNELILKQGSGPTIPTRANAQKRYGDVLTDKQFETYVREYGRVMSERMFKNRRKLENMKPGDYDDELEKYARGYSIDGIKIRGASDAAVLAVKRMQ